MNSPFRAYFAVTCVGSFLLIGLGVFVQFHAIGLFGGGSTDAGLAGALFGFVLAGCGVVLFQMGRRYAIRESDLARRKQLDPDQPWRWRDDWKDGILVDRSSYPIPMLATAAFVSSLALYSGYRAANSSVVQDFDGEILLAIVIGLTAWCWILAMRRWRGWNAFGEFRLTLKSTPITPGGALVANLATDIAPSALNNVDVHLSLVCVRTYQQNVRHSRSERNTIVWRAETRGVVGLGVSPADAGRVVIPVRFEIPADATPSNNESGSGDHFEWSLIVTTKIGSTRATKKFSLPVFDNNRAQENSLVVHPNDVQGRRDSSVTPDSAQDGASASKGIVVSTQNGKTSIAIEPSRQASFAFAAIGFTIAWILAVSYLAVQEAPIVLTVLAALFTVVPIYGTACILLERTVIVVDGTGVVISRTLGPVRYSRRIPAADVADLFLSSFASVGSINYFDLILVTTRGRRILLVGRQCGQSVVEWIGFQINAALGKYGRVAFSGAVVGMAAPDARSTESARDRAMMKRGSTISQASTKSGSGSVH